MATTQLVLDFLKQQGFCPEVTENGNLFFKYQMANFLYLNNDEDEEFFQLVMPGIFDVTEENRELVLEICNKTTCGIKVAKAVVQGENVNLYFEIFLDHSPEVKDILPRALGVLNSARQEFYSHLK